MSFHLFENDESETTVETLTPKGEDTKQVECYTCTECSSNIEIKYINEINNKILFECPKHGDKKMTIKEYFKKMDKNTYLYSECSLCKKQQNKINNNTIFKYCFDCKKIICNNCIFNHEKNHFLIQNDYLCIKCQKHPK